MNWQDLTPHTEIAAAASGAIVAGIRKGLSYADRIVVVVTGFLTAVFFAPWLSERLGVTSKATIVAIAFFVGYSAHAVMPRVSEAVSTAVPKWINRRLEKTDEADEPERENGCHK